MYSFNLTVQDAITREEHSVSNDCVYVFREEAAAAAQRLAAIFTQGGHVVRSTEITGDEPAEGQAAQ